MSETIPERVERIAREYPDKIAVAQGEWAITYRDLLPEIAQEAEKMRQAGLNPA